MNNMIFYGLYDKNINDFSILDKQIRDIADKRFGTIFFQKRESNFEWHDKEMIEAITFAIKQAHHYGMKVCFYPR